MQIATAVVRDGFAMTLNGCSVLLLCDLMVQIATAVVRDGFAMTPKGCGVLLLCDLMVQIATSAHRCSMIRKCAGASSQ